MALSRWRFNMVLYDKLNSYVEEKEVEDSRELAEMFLDDLDRNDLVIMLAAEIDEIRRANIRRKEKYAFSSELIERFGSMKDTRLEPNPEFLTLMKSNFSLGDGFTAQWGEATIEQHKRRIAYLERMKGGIESTISYHQKAIEIIEAAGAKCLNETLVTV
jgi:hypothetical protein